MNSFFRGAIEKHIDFLLSDANLDTAYETLTKGFVQRVENINDALFGYVIGRVMEYASMFLLRHHKKPSIDDLPVIEKILERRAMEIKLKIASLPSRHIKTGA